jgi:hypothetical protein
MIMAIKPTGEHERLGRFEGSWIGMGHTHPSPWGPGSAATSSWVGRFDPPRLNLIVDYLEHREDGSRFDAHGVMTVDPADGQVLWYLFDSFGYPPLTPYRGAWSDTRLVLDKQTPRGLGRTCFQLSDGQFLQEIESKVIDAPAFVPVSTMRFTRP